MQMINFLFFGLVASAYCVLYFSEKWIKDERVSNVVSSWALLVFSYLFISYGDFRSSVILVLLSFATWFFSRKEETTVYGIAIALAVLVFFKWNGSLPIGLSFYTFSAISYLADVKRRKTEMESLKNVALYLAFFPKLTSGPIQRSKDFFRQIEGKRELGWNSFSIGIQIFAFGLFKKLVLADRLSVFVNQVYKTPKVFGSLTVFFAVVSYSLQIYFDFSGYTDMAVGVAKILGFQLPRNFNLPYLAHNVTEFWKRWHISLSSWLQEYLYISFGGNRKGKVRTYGNLILTMVLGGIWHGSSWTYVFWGLLHGIALILHKIWMKTTGSPDKEQPVFIRALAVTGTFLFTTFCWIFFRAESLPQAFAIIGRIFSFQKGLEQPYLWSFFAIAVLLACSVAAAVRSGKAGLQAKKKNMSFVEAYYPILDLRKFWNLVIFFVFCGLILCFAYTGGSPFIYGNY